MKPRILFIAWDGPLATYMEGLFMPIFHEVSKAFPCEFHVLHFTPKDAEAVRKIKDTATNLDIQYTHVRVKQKPFRPIGSLLALVAGPRKVEQYIRKHQIDIVMPRSNVPASMVLKIKNRNFKIVFDADGLPIEERIDFAGLTRSSGKYKWMKRQEHTILREADRVITRSQKAIELHLSSLGQEYREKFSVVYNGRDKDFFQPDEHARKVKRRELGFAENEKVLVYCGSLGPQYGWDEMLNIFSLYAQQYPARWLILANNPAFTDGRIPDTLKGRIVVKTVPFNEVPVYLDTADIGFAIRKPTFSMQGVSPIKLGEYLLMGLPTIASKGIGDTDVYLHEMEGCFMFDHFASHQEQAVVKWLGDLQKVNKDTIRQKALIYFSLEAAANSYLPAFGAVSYSKSFTTTPTFQPIIN